jgi:hypothetical protein
MASNIPEARRILEDLLEKSYEENEAVRAALRLMTRVQTKKRVKSYRNPVTAQVCTCVKETVRTHPHWSCDMVGEHWGLDGGRVSEIIAGKHDHLIGV